MKIGIIGWWHHDNQGDLAMLETLTRALETQQVVPIDVGFDINADALQRLNQLDFLLLGGGTQFQSTPPFPFDTFDVWGQDLHTPVGAIGMGIDMIAPQYRPAVTRLVEQAAFFYVRDQHSRQIVDHPKVQIAPDITFLKPVPPARLPDDSHERQIVCGVNLRRTPGLQTDRWIEALKNLPYTLRGIPFSTFQGWQEMPILQQLDKTCATVFQPNLYDGLDLMLGTGFHSVVFAVQAAVPVIAIASTPKVRRFMCDIGLDDYLLEPDDWSKLGELTDRVLSERKQLRQQLRQISATLTESAQQAMTKVQARIDKAAVRQKDTSPKVSLLIVGGTASEANRLSLESCLDQTYANLEVLFIGNDPEISGHDTLTPTRLKVIPTDAESLGARLNLAFSQTAGEYLSWITSGDFYTRDAIECMVNRLQSEPAYDMVFTDFYTTHDHKRIVDAHLVLEPGKLIRRNVVGPNFLFRRRLSDVIGPLRMDTPLVDYDYWLRANTVCRLKPMHVLLFYSQLSHQVLYSRTAERTTRRRWYATRPWLMRAVGYLVDTDFIESFVVCPLLAIRRGIRRLVGRPPRFADDTANRKPDMTPESLLRVTVIIPSYNRANYLPVAIDSILAQSYPVFEIVIVDDGSIDNTPEVVKAYGNQVRFYERGHQGVSAARNYGLELAQGDVIAWLDADDVWEPEFLAGTVPLLENDPALDGVYTGIAHIDDAGNLLPQSNIRTVPPRLLFSALLEEDFVLTPTVVVRKRCFDQVGKFDEQFHICEDYDMWLRLAKSFTLQGVPQPLVRVRIHSGNTLRDTSALVHYRLLVVSKHFGAVDGDPATWSADKRMAQAFALRDVAFVEIQAGQTEQGWAHLERASLCWPALLDGPRTFYELALGNQQRGQRGQIDPAQIQRNEVDMLQQIGKIIDRSGETLKSMRRVAFGNAYVALSMLAEQAGDWHLARSYAFKAIRSNPRLGIEPKMVRRLIKTVAGPQVVGRLRQLRGTSTAMPQATESTRRSNDQQA